MNFELERLLEKAPRVNLGSVAKRITRINDLHEYGLSDVRGVSNSKEIVPTKANVTERALERFYVVYPGEFVFNRRVHGTGARRLGLGFNCTTQNFIFTEDYVVFSVDRDKVLPEFLFIFFRREDFNRYVVTNSWEDMCRVKIPLPPIEVQRAYVDAYKGLTALIEENEALLKSLEATAQACVAECREKWPMVAIGDYIKTFTRKNSEDLDLPFMGVNREKQIVPTSANTENIDRRKYSILKCGEFVFSGMQTGRDVCIRIALSEIKTDILLSPAYTTFRVDPTKPILPEYFFLNFKSSEMDRQGWFKSDSSIRSNLDWERFCEIQIPLPPIEVQRAIVALYHCAEEARRIASEAKEQLAQVCPAMIQRASVIKKV